MNVFKKSLLSVSILVVIVSVFAVPSEAALINGQNWADTVVSYTSEIQNYAGAAMTSSTEFWVLGQSDSDQNGDMKFVEADGDFDYVGGWRGVAADQEIVVGFVTPLTNIAGDDLVIRMYCGSKGSASVSVSADGNSWTPLGIIIGASGQVPGKSGFLYDATFDFDGVFASDVSYVKVHRETVGSGSGMFFDSFASVPEPMTLVLLGLGAICIRRKK